MDIETNHTKLLTGIDPARSLGLAVSYLMAKPAFAKLPFGYWSRVLVGQINRGHYLIAQRDQRVVGFLGWALTSREKAELWLSGKGDLSFKDSQAGEILLINAWAAENNDVTQLMLERLREIGQPQAQVYYKRFYPDGRMRPCRLAVNKFVDAHIRAARQAPDTVQSS
jgi:hemolysin-activating ACP:hemolysin acyltransferase